MTKLIMFPFQVREGQVVTADDGSDTYVAAELAQLCLTLEGERELEPSYGIKDPTFQDFDPADFSHKALVFGPEGLQITNIRMSQTRKGKPEVMIDFTMDSPYDVGSYSDLDFDDSFIDEEL